MLLLEDFKDAKSIIGRKPSTIYQYDLAVRRLAEFTNNKRFEDVTTQDLRDYLRWCKDTTKNSSVTLRNKMDALLAFYNFLYDENIVKRNPVKAVGTIAVEKRLKKTLSGEEMEALRQASYASTRDRALLEFLYSTGVRVSECTKVEIKDCNLDTGEVFVTGKGSKERIVYLNNNAKYYIRKFLKERPPKNKYSPLFPNQKGGKMCNRNVQLILSKIAEKAGVEDVYPHKIRRTMATDLINRGMPIEQVKVLLGHEYLDTTMIYYTSVGKTVKGNFHRYSFD